MPKVELTKEQGDALVNFLQRINLNAKEVPTYVELVNIFQKERQGEEKKSVDQKGKKG